MIKLLYITGLVLYLVSIGNETMAQVSYPELFEMAKSHSADIVKLETTKKYLSLEESKIKVDNLAPKTYLSSEVLFAPYFNNNGKIISTNPNESALGYDVAITSGGLYSCLLNTEIPLFNRKQVNNLLDQNNLEILRAENQLNKLIISLKYSLAIQYLDALASQAEYQSLLEKSQLLKQQLDITKSLTDHGLYRFVDYRLMLSAYSSDSLNVENSKTTYRLKLNQLYTVCGVSDTTFKKLRDFDSEINRTKVDTSVFLQTYAQDSLSAIYQQKVFENQYKPQVRLYANTGLNSTTIPNMANHFGMSAGIQLTYTLFDRKQKKINRQQEQLIIDQAAREKEIKQFEIQKQKTSYFEAIKTLDKSIKKEEKLQNDYQEILSIYNDELKKAQVGIIDYLNFLEKINQNKLALENHRIERDKLVVEYNYWNN